MIALASTLCNARSRALATRTQSEYNGSVCASVGREQSLLLVDARKLIIRSIPP